MNRVDTKYVFSEEDLPTLLENIRPAYRALSFDNTHYTCYSSLYFDSPQFDCYLQHHNGRLNRHKYRMREYHSTGDCFFEIKQKNNKGRTVKSRMAIPAIEESFSEDAQDFLNNQVGKGLDLKPKLWTKFSRITLVDANCTERVTLDCNVEFRTDQRLCKLPGVVIAEVKQKKDSRHSSIRQQLRIHKVRPLRVSKYCLGTHLLNPELKSNRFKSKLRAIQKLA